MDEVGGALIAIALVLSAVFIPAAFIPGISGQFFRQFAITIASATIISCLCSLTLSPALCALLFKPHQEHAGPRIAADASCHRVLPRLQLRLRQSVGRLWRIDPAPAARRGFGPGRLCRAHRTDRLAVRPRAHRLYPEPRPGILDHRAAAAARRLARPHRRRGARTAQILRDTPGVAHAVQFAGFDGATFTNAPNAGAIFSPLQPFQERAAKGLSADAILADLRTRLAKFRMPSSSRSRRRRCAASAPPAASR